MRTLILLSIVAIGLSSCTRPRGNFPSLAPRSAEAVDPRVPVYQPVRSGPVDPTLSAHLAALIDQAQAGDSAFQAAAATAERLAASAGPGGSESWVSAQQALSAAQEARGPTTRALGDIDGLGSTALATKGGISAADMAAIEAAAQRVSEIDRSQAQRLKAILARLGS